MTRPDIEYRARTVVHLLELLDGPTSVDPEFEKIRTAIRECSPALYELTGELLPEQATPMGNPAGAFYLLALAEALEGMINSVYVFEVPEYVSNMVNWLCSYFREQLGNGFLVTPKDWGMD